MVGGVDEITTLNMNMVELVTPEPPEPQQSDSPEPAFQLELIPYVPKEFADIETVSLNSTETETETTAVDCQNETLTEAPPDSSDGEPSSESGQQDFKSDTESPIEKSLNETNSVVSDDSQDVVCTTSVTSAQNSNTASEVNSDQDSLDQDHDMAALQKSLHLFTYSVGNRSSTQSSFQSDRECDVHNKPASPEQNHNSAVDTVNTSEDKMNSAAEAGSSKYTQQSMVSEKVTDDSQTRVNSVENNSPETTQTEPTSFKISEKDVKQKRGELASANQPSYDTAWRSSGDGGRFRIRSIINNVSYTDVFGADTEMRANSARESRELHGSSKRATDISADAKLVTSPVSTVRNSEDSKTEEQKLTAVNERKYVNEVTADVTTHSQHQQIDSVTATKLSMKAKQGSHDGKGDKNISLEKNELPTEAYTDVHKCKTIDSLPPVSINCSQDVPSSSGNVSRTESDFNKPDVYHSFTTASDAVSDETVRDGDSFVDKNSSNSEITSVSVSFNAEKSAASLADPTQDNRTRKFNSPHDAYKGKTVRQRETIVIDKSNLASVGGLNRRVYGASRSPSEAKLTANTAQLAGNSSVISATRAASVNENKLQKSSAPENVAKELPRTELGKSTVDIQNVAASITENPSQPDVARNRQNSNSTVVRVVNGRIVDESASVTSSAVSKRPPTLPKNNIRVVRHEQLPNDRSSSQFKMVGDGHGATTADDAATPISSAISGIDVQLSVAQPVNELNTTTRNQLLDSKISSVACTGDRNSKTRTENQVSATPKVSEPRLQAANNAGSTNSSGRKTTPTAQNAAQPTVGSRAEIQQSQVHSTTVQSTGSNAASPKPSSLQHNTSVPAAKPPEMTLTAESSGTEQNAVLAQARSMLRPMYRPVTTSEVPTSSGSNSSPSKFILRSASSSRTSYAVEQANSAQHKPTLDGIGSKTIGNGVISNQSHGRTFKFMTPPYAGKSSTLPFAGRSSYSTPVRGSSSRQSSMVSSPTSDEVDVAQTSTFDVKPKFQTESETSTVLDSRVVEVEKVEKGIKSPSPRFADASSQDPVKVSAVNSDSEAESDAVNPAAAALAALHPVKLRTAAKPLSPPKLTLHERLMIAIRDAGGSVPTTLHTVPDRSKSVDASTSSSAETPNSLSISRSTLHEPPSSHAPTTDRLPGKHSASSSVTAAKKTRRTIDPPKPTPHEQLMMAIRNAGGVTARKAADTDRSLDSATAFLSPRLTSTVAERSQTSMVEPSSSLPQISLDNHVTDGNGSSVSSAVHTPPAAPGPPPPSAPLSLSPSSTVVPKAVPRKLTPDARSSATRTPPQPQSMDTREALLTAIRDAAGGKGLRKVSKARCPFKRNRLRKRNRKKRKRLRWQAANHGCHCFDGAFLLAGGEALAFLVVFVYATHATQAIAFEWKPGFSGIQ